MCQRCADFDFPIADIWRPCYQASRRAPARPHSWSDEDYEASRIIAELRYANRQQQQRVQFVQAENEVLRQRIVELEHRQPRSSRPLSPAGPAFETIRVVNE